MTTIQQCTSSCSWRRTSTSTTSTCNHHRKYTRVICMYHDNDSSNGYCWKIMLWFLLHHCFHFLLYALSLALLLSYVLQIDRYRFSHAKVYITLLVPSLFLLEHHHLSYTISQIANNSLCSIVFQWNGNNDWWDKDVQDMVLYGLKGRGLVCTNVEEKFG